MAGDLLALGAAGALALASIAGKRSGSKAEREAPRVFFDEIEPTISILRPELDRAVRRRDGWRDMVARFTGVPAPAVAMDALGDSAARGWYATWAFERAGRQTFVLGPRMQELLLRTAVKVVPPEFLRFPYPAYYLALPGSDLKLYKPGRGILAVRGISVVVLDERKVMLLVWAPGRDPLDYVDASILIDLERAALHPRGFEGYMSSIHSYGMAMRGYTTTWPKPMLAMVDETQRMVVRLVINSMLYLQAENAERKLDRDRAEQDRAARQARKRLGQLERILGSKPDRRARRAAERERKRLERDSGRLPPPGTVTWLGRSVELDPIEAARQRVEGVKMRRHWVRGHWKVPHRKRAPPRLIWVQPFQRGGGGEGPAYRKRRYEWKE
jgi:hypothetical protein